MAKTKWWVVWDLEQAGSGYNGVAPFTKFRKGETLPPEELTGGLTGTVFQGKVAAVEAEGEEEAIKIAGEAYGERSGIGAVPHAEKELKFYSL